MTTRHTQPRGPDRMPSRRSGRSIRIRTAVASLAVVLASCTTSNGEEAAMVDTETLVPPPPSIQATNAFYYYEDVEAAWAFYTEVLGLETLADYGFAKIMQVAPASLLTLVDAERGMHSADEPKSVTLAIVTEQVSEWYEHLTTREVPMRAELNIREGSAHDGFVAIDPEGYFLEFEWFNEHAENVALSPRLAEVDALTTPLRPAELGIVATVQWLYYDDLAPLQSFYEELFDVDMIVDQGWAKVYPLSSTGYLGLVDASRGLHKATEDKGVTLSFLTADVDQWLDRTRAMGVALRHEEIQMESDLVRTFVAYDPTGYFLEWDTFLDRPGNERIVAILR